MAPSGRSIKQSNVKPNSNSVQPTRLRTRISRANDRITGMGESSKANDSSGKDENTASPPYEPNEGSVKRKQGQSSKESKKKKPNEKKEPTKKKKEEELESIRDMNDINPAIVDIPRPAGAPFADAVSPDTLQFMADLAENNEREFMLLHNERWQKARQDFTDFVSLAMQHAREMDPTILDCPAKDAVYRLKYDLYFSTRVNAFLALQKR